MGESREQATWNWKLEGLALPMWVVYKHPADYPHCYVVRLFDIDLHTDQHGIGPSLEAVRLLIPFGAVRLDRHENDEPQIVECWL